MSICININVCLGLSTILVARHLGRDLHEMFLLAQNALKDGLHAHLATGSCISLTINTWSARNYRQFITVIGHWIDIDWKLHSRTIDLLKLTEPIHSSDYLTEKLLEITSSMLITRGVFTITRDNAKPNDIMLEEYKLATYLLDVPALGTASPVLEHGRRLTDEERLLVMKLCQSYAQVYLNNKPLTQFWKLIQSDFKKQTKNPHKTLKAVVESMVKARREHIKECGTRREPKGGDLNLAIDS
jgi:hypothetical protein